MNYDSISFIIIQKLMRHLHSRTDLDFQTIKFKTTKIYRKGYETNVTSELPTKLSRPCSVNNFPPKRNLATLLNDDGVDVSTVTRVAAGGAVDSQKGGGVDFLHFLSLSPFGGGLGLLLGRLCSTCIPFVAAAIVVVGSLQY